MPTARRRRSRHLQAVTLDALDCPQMLSLSAGWSPPEIPFEIGRAYWHTWEQFLSDYAQVRAEFLETAFYRPGTTPFAEWLYQRTGGDARRVAELEAEGRSIVEAAQREYPPSRMNPVLALFRMEERA